MPTLNGAEGHRRGDSENGGWPSASPPYPQIYSARQHEAYGAGLPDPPAGRQMRGRSIQDSAASESRHRDGAEASGSHQDGGGGGFVGWLRKNSRVSRSGQGAPTGPTGRRREGRESLSREQPVEQPLHEEGRWVLQPFGEQYRINCEPKQVFLKLRQEVEGHCAGVNYELHSKAVKFVVKPTGRRAQWRASYSLPERDAQFLTKKLPLGPYLRLQVGVGHDFRHNTTGLKWKLTTPWTTSVQPSASQLTQKVGIAILPNFHLKAGFSAEYTIPDLHGGIGTGDRPIDVNRGYLDLTVQRVEAVVTLAG